MKKFIAIVLLITVLSASSLTIYANNRTNYAAENTRNVNLELDAASAVLIEATSGTVLFEQNPNEPRSPASVTKVMTLLLIMEALDSGKIKLDDKVYISAEAASMGGSQVFLEEGEEMCIEELIKCTVIASANDAAVALAEHVYGSESAFVNAMNMRAKEMGLKNTFFENVTGLDDNTEYHKTSAADIAVMSCELIKYPLITKYSSIWQDTIRDGEFTLTNTNRLVRYYNGCNGLKTGSTDKAGYCVSASAVRDGMTLIAVVMGAETKEDRNSSAKAMLDYGFANFAVYHSPEKSLEEVKVVGGTKSTATLYSEEFSCVIPKAELKRIEMIYEIPDKISAPMEEAQSCGKIIFKIGDTKIGECKIIVKECINRISFSDVFALILKKIFFMEN